MKKVIDLSKFNQVMDWSKVKAAVDAVVLRLGYRGAHTGTITYDPKYQEYVSACQKLGIPIMIYFFPCSITKAEAEAEAKFIIAAAEKVNLCGPIWVDSEVVYQDRSGRSDNLSKKDRTTYLNVILSALRAAGYDCGVYASTSWFKNNLNDSDLTDCRRWVAEWAHKCSYGTFEYSMWQYTSKGAIPGINGNVDLSECYLNLDKTISTQASRPVVTRQDIVDQICSWEGWSEANGKFRKIIDIYNYYLPAAVKSGTMSYKVRYTDEWCATAASAAYIQAGAPELFPIECGCPRNIRLAQQMGIWQEADNYVPQPADAVVYDWQDSGSGDNKGTPDHIGIVIGVNRPAGNIIVMEGNKDETVGRRILKIDSRYIRGFICPKFVSDTNVGNRAVAKAAGVYEVSKTGTPSKKAFKTGLLKYGKRVTARLQPASGAGPCSFSPIDGLTKISVCDTITDKEGIKWDYCCVDGKYGFILKDSIESYLRTGGQSMDTVVKWVWDGDFGNDPVRSDSLKKLGYNPVAVQAGVNALHSKPVVSKSRHPHIRIWAIPPFFEGDQGERLYGASVAIIQYDATEKPEHVVLIDSGMVKDGGKLKPTIVSDLKKAGVTKINALLLSHPHGDHYGMFSDIFANFTVKHLYLPPYDGLRKLGLARYASATMNQESKARKHGAGCTYLKPGMGFTVGSIRCDCIFQADPKKLAHSDGHEAVNSLSIYTRFTLDNIWRLHNAGDAENDANNLFVAAVKDARADVMVFHWHTDGNATNEKLLKAIQPKVAISNYHHKERSGRGAVRKKAEAVGATVARNWENGHIYADICGGKMKLSCSKNNLAKTWTAKKDLDGKEISDEDDIPGYKVCLTTKAKPAPGASGLLAIEPEDYTDKEIKALKDAGYTVLGYLSVGSVSDERSYYKALEPYTLRKLDDWEHERYLDVCRDPVRQWAVKRGKEILKRGCDGLWIDNLDVYEEYPSEAAYNGITAILQELYPLGYIMINGGLKYVSKALTKNARIAHGVTQEEVFTRIVDYDAPGTFEAQKSAQSAEYQKYVALALSHGMGAFLLEYTADEKLKKKIADYCSAIGAGYCISASVDL